MALGLMNLVHIFSVPPTSMATNNPIVTWTKLGACVVGMKQRMAMLQGGVAGCCNAWSSNGAQWTKSQ